MRPSGPTGAQELTLTRDGAQWHQKVLDGEALDTLKEALSGLPADRAGVRLHGISALGAYLMTDGAVGAIATKVLGELAQPVRAVLFDKTARANWKLGWHQDRTIVVRRRIDVVGYGPWSMKAGLRHVAPPFDLLEDMVTLRVHLDRTAIDNAPLLIATGSHRLGRIFEADIGRAVQECATFICTAEAGDVWLYATPILHASDAAVSPTRRRVLQVDYCARDLPDGLEWLGI
jgi:Phytanoyl-CoA dioxygenase (PhyH)